MKRRTFLTTSTLAGLAWYLGRGAAWPSTGLPRSPAREVSPEGASTTTGPARLCIRGGTVVTAEGRRRADVRVEKGKVTGLADSLVEQPGEQVIDARGLHLLPGGIDPHVHLNIPTPYSWAYGDPADDFGSGSSCALAGGITTVGSIVFPRPGEGPLEAVRREAVAARESAIADVLLTPVALAPSWFSFALRLLGVFRQSDFANLTAELPALAAEGHTSLKIFMNLPEFHRNAAAYEEVLGAAGKAGLLTMLHCEDYPALSEAAASLAAQKKTSLRHFPESRPVASEVRATEQAVRMCERTGAPIYVVHLSSAAALRVCEKARARGLPVYVESRPIYLHFTRERYAREDGALYVSHPPLRERRDQEALWEGLAAGTVDTIGSDHIAWTREEKLDPSWSIERHRPGMNNLEVMLPMLYSEGVRKSRLTLERFVAVTSTNAARLFGLYPRKGTIQIGSDADVVLWDLEASRTIRNADVISASGFSIYDGWEVTGWPRLTIRRGEMVHGEGRAIGNTGPGEVLRRERLAQRAPASRTSRISHISHISQISQISQT